MGGTGTKVNAILITGNVVIFLLLGVLIRWALDRQYRSFRDDQERMHRFFERSVDAMDVFGKEITKGQTAILIRVEDANKSSVDKILGAIGEMTSANNASTGALIVSLQVRENRTVDAIERLLISLREDLPTLRPPPPPGGTGSAVRDSGGKP